MNWISNVVRPRIRSFLTTKREVPDNLWVQCPESGQMVFSKDLEANQFVVPGSGCHMRMGAQARLAHTFDDGAYETLALPDVPTDPLKFRDGRRYTDRLKDAKATTELDDAVRVGEGKIEGQPCVVAVQDFRFMGGSLGMAAGEAVLTGMLRAVELGRPFILFAASGGARMQEGILSLMQMPRTTIAVQKLRDHKLPYIVVLTDPTTGGVTASYAMLGDIHIAEPGALICFAGPRVIQQTIREQLPDGFQRAEYLLEHGMIDMVVHRHDMRATLGRCLRLLTANGAKAALSGREKPTAQAAGPAPAMTVAPAKNGKVPASDAPEDAETARPGTGDGATGNGASQVEKPSAETSSSNGGSDQAKAAQSPDGPTSDKPAKPNGAAKDADRPKPAAE